LSVSIHAFVQDTDDFDAMGIRASKENDVTALGELSVAFSNVVGVARDLWGFGESVEGVKQLADVGVTLWLAPLSQCVFRDLFQVRICHDGKSESLHSR
jgi:hypothetical protein